MRKQNIEIGMQKLVTTKDKETRRAQKLRVYYILFQRTQVLFLAPPSFILLTTIRNSSSRDSNTSALTRHLRHPWAHSEIGPHT